MNNNDFINRNNFRMSLGRAILMVFMLLIVVVGGTFAWLTFASKESALVLTIGNINNTQITLTPYQIKEDGLTPVNTYTSGVSSNVTVVNGDKSNRVTLFYKINELDTTLINNGLKYTIVNVATDGTENVVKTGDFTSFVGQSEAVIYDEDATKNSTTNYKVYLWVDSTKGNQNDIAGSKVDVELNGAIGSVEIAGSENTYGETLVANITDFDTHINSDSAFESNTDYTVQWYVSSNNNMSGASSERICNATSRSYTIGSILTGDDTDCVDGSKAIFTDKYIYVLVTVRKDNYTKVYKDLADGTTDDGDAGNGSDKVLPRPISVKANPGTKTYDGTALKVSACEISSSSENSLLADHALSCVMTDDSTITNAGTQTNTINTATIKYGAYDLTSNYSITKETGTLTINKKSIAVSWDYSNADKTIDGVPVYTYNGQKQAPTATVTTGVTGETITLSKTAGINVGSYTSTVSCASVTGGQKLCSNYTLTNTESETFNITAKEVSVVWGDTTTFIYNGQEQAPTATVTTDVSGETMSVTRTTGIDIGKYTSEASCSSVTGGQKLCSNYKLTNTTQDFSIVLRTVTVIASSPDKTYDGKALTDNTCTMSGNVEGHTVTCTMTSASTITNAGTQSNVINTVKIMNGTTDVTDNYGITKTDGTLTINKKSIAVSWDYSNADKTIDGVPVYTYNGQEQAPTATVTTGVSGETMNVTRTTGTDAGSYTSVASCSSITGGQKLCSNYILTNTTKAFTIEKATNPIAVTTPQTWSTTFSTSSQTKGITAATGGQGSVTYTIQSQTNKSGTAVTYVSISSTTVTMAASTPVSGSSYTVVIRATAAGNDNYNSGYKDITLTVTVGKASCACTISSAPSLSYPGTNITTTDSSPSSGTIEYSCTGDGTIGVTSGTTGVITVGTIGSTSSPLTASGIGSSKITVSRAEGANYKACTSDSETISVPGTEYTVTLNNQSATTAGTTSVVATYGSAMPSITVPAKTGWIFTGYYSNTNAFDLTYDFGGTTYRRVNLKKTANNWGMTTASDSGKHIHGKITVVDSALTSTPTLQFNDSPLTKNTHYTVTSSNGTYVYYLDFDLTDTMVSKRGNYDYGTDYRFIDIEGGGITASTSVTVNFLTVLGKKYYTSSGSSNWNYDIAGDTTLYARWIDETKPTTPTLKTIYNIWGTEPYGINGNTNGYVANAGINGEWETRGNDPYIYFNNLDNFTGITGAYVELEESLSTDLGIQIFYAPNASSTGYYNNYYTSATLKAGETKILISLKHTCDASTDCDFTKIRFDLGTSTTPVKYKIKALGVLADANQWNNNNIYIQGTTTELGSGVNNWQYTYSDSATEISTATENDAKAKDALTKWVPWDSSNYTTFISSAFTIARNQLVYIRTCDKAGNCSDKTSTYIKIDKTAPSDVTITGSGSGTQVTLSYTDDNGVIGYYFGTTNPATGSITYTSIESTTKDTQTKTITTSGTYYLSVIDVAGNVTTVSKTIITLAATFNFYNNQIRTIYCNLIGDDTSCSLETPEALGAPGNEFAFNGWSTSTDASATGNIGPRSSVTISANTPYYAVYKRPITGYSGLSTNKTTHAGTQYYNTGKKDEKGKISTVSLATESSAAGFGKVVASLGNDRWKFLGWRTDTDPKNDTDLISTYAPKVTESVKPLYAVYYSKLYFSSGLPTSTFNISNDGYTKTTYRTQYYNSSGDISSISSMTPVKINDSWSVSGWKFASTATANASETVYKADSSIQPSVDSGTASAAGEATLYALYSRSITFKSGINGATNHGSETQYYNAAGNISSISSYDPTAITGWDDPLGWTSKTDEYTKEYNVFSTEGSITPAVGMNTNILYAVYSRTLTFKSGINKATTDGTRTQSYNSSGNITSFYSYDSVRITGWTRDGYRVDETASGGTYNYGSGKIINYPVDSSSNTFYAVYDRTINFYSGNAPFDIDDSEVYTPTCERTQYYNTVNKLSSISSCVPDSLGGTDSGWSALGWIDGNTDASTATTAKYSIYSSGTTLATLTPGVNDSSELVAIYSRNVYFYSGINYDTNSYYLYDGPRLQYYNSYDVLSDIKSYSPTYTAALAPNPIYGGYVTAELDDNGWTIVGYVGITKATNSTSYLYNTGTSTDITPAVSTPNKLYALYKRTITVYSGVNKESSSNLTQYLNSYYDISSVTLPVIKTISNWTPLGYATSSTSTTVGTDSAGNKYEANYSYSPAATENPRTFWAVYSRSQTVPFYSGLNASKTTVNKSATVYYNTNTSSVPTTFEITVPSSATSIGGVWESSGGFKQNSTTANESSLKKFDTSLTLTFGTTYNYYAVYKRTIHFYSGIDKAKDSTKDQFYNTGSSSGILSSVTSPTKDDSQDLGGDWSELGWTWNTNPSVLDFVASVDWDYGTSKSNPDWDAYEYYSIYHIKRTLCSGINCASTNSIAREQYYISSNNHTLPNPTSFVWVDIANIDYGWSTELGYNCESDGYTATMENNDGFMAPGAQCTNAKIYAVYSRTVTFKSGINGETSKTRTQYYNSSNSVSSIASYDPADISGWSTELGWTASTSAVSSATYAKTGNISPGVSVSNTLYAVYSRKIPFKSGISAATTDSEPTQYYNSYNVTSNVTAPTPSSINNSWTILGYRDDTTADVAEVDSGGSTSPGVSVTAMYAVYKASVCFWSWVAPPGYGSSDGCSSKYYNSSSSTKTFNVTTPTSASGSVTDWTFYGWNTSSTASSGSRYSAGTTVSFAIDSVPTFYAVYTRNVSFYNYNGSSTQVTQYRVQNSYSATSPGKQSAVPTNWSHIGWRDDTTAGVKETNNNAVTTSSASSFYAVYSRSVSVVYNSNGSSVSGVPGNTTKVIYSNANNAGILSENSVTLTLSTNTPSRTSYTFNGWNTNSSGTGTSYVPGATITISGLTSSSGDWTTNLYASWVIIATENASSSSA